MPCPASGPARGPCRGRWPCSPQLRGAGHRDGRGRWLTATLMDILADNGEDIQDQVGRRQQALRLAQLIVARLGRRERQVLQLRYGFGGSERRTQREIAQEMGISRSYVSRIEKKAMRKISRELEREREAEG